MNREPFIIILAVWLEFCSLGDPNESRVNSLRFVFVGLTRELPKRNAEVESLCLPPCVRLPSVLHSTLIIKLCVLLN